MAIRGVVTVEKRGGQSKSARDAVVLRTGEETYVLRILGGNSFSDPRLNALVGKTLEAEGEVHAGVLVMREWRVVG